MLIRLLLCLIVAMAGGASAAATKSFELIFTDDRLSELHTEDFEVCFFGDASCYPDDFDVGDPYRSPLAPFAGLTPGDEVLFEVTETSWDTATCSFGGLFTCDADFGYAAKTGDRSELLGFNIFDWIGDISITADLEKGVLSFFGAAGSYAPGGCAGSDVPKELLPEGYCDFYGYEADFVIASGTGPGDPERTAPVPLPNAMLLMLAGLLGFAGMSRGRFMHSA